MVPVGVFCQLFQIGVPSLLQPLRRKRAFPRIFGAALGTTFCMYTLLGLAAAAVLGDDVDPSCNLNWASHKRRAVALAVALFPALDCLSVFPMNAISLYLPYISPTSPLHLPYISPTSRRSSR